MATRLAIDIGGTFTDVVLDRDGARTTTKVLTTPGRPADAFMEGVAIVLAEAGVEASSVDLILHGTTLATNALIESALKSCSIALGRVRTLALVD